MANHEDARARWSDRAISVLNMMLEYERDAVRATAESVARAEFTDQVLQYLVLPAHVRKAARALGLPVPPGAYFNSTVAP